MSSSAIRMPVYHELLWPTLVAIRELGGSATIPEINERVIANEAFTEQQQTIPHGNGRSSEIEYRLAWARSNLKGLGATENSQRGVWSITEFGRSLTRETVRTTDRDWRLALAARRRSTDGAQTAQEAGRTPADDDGDTGLGWKDQLVTRLLGMPPDAFERLAQRLLREAGLTNVTVTGRSGDRGLDGVGVYQLSLVSFPVFFQCKRYADPVGPGAVRDFRGAMAGRGEKGLLITTSSFTRDAKLEASRDGAPPVELIDGDRLCDLLREHGLGVRVTTRTEVDVAVVGAFFDDI